MQNESVTDTRCYEAFQTILVAGEGSTYLVGAGGNVTFIAGENILYYPGTRIDSGGYMLGYIAPGGPWCTSPSMVTTVTGLEKPGKDASGNLYRLYPNPSDDRFYLEDISDAGTAGWIVEIFDMNGARVYYGVLDEKKVHAFSLDGQPTGIYLVRVVAKTGTGTTRIMLNNR